MPLWQFRAIAMRHKKVVLALIDNSQAVRRNRQYWRISSAF
jgi:hypothetical protein